MFSKLEPIGYSSPENKRNIMIKIIFGYKITRTVGVPSKQQLLILFYIL